MQFFLLVIMGVVVDVRSALMRLEEALLVSGELQWGYQL